MDFLKYSEYLLRRIRERQETLSRTLSTGSAQDYAQYQRLVGEISGLNFAEHEIVTLHGNLEENDE